MAKFVPEHLRKAAETYEQRNALYGDNYKEFGDVLLALLGNDLLPPPGVDLAHHYCRLGVLVQIVGKLSRYCANFNRGGHADSLDDLAVYAMMLRELDADIKPMTHNEMDIETYGCEGVG